MKSLLAGVSDHVAQRGAFGRKLKDFAAVQGTVSGRVGSSRR